MAEWLKGRKQEGVSRGVRDGFWLPMGAGSAQCSFLEGAELKGAVSLPGGSQGDHGDIWEAQPLSLGD